MPSTTNGHESGQHGNTLLHEMARFRQLYEDLERILESSHDGIFVTDGHGTVLWLNAASAHICGRDRGELIGQNVADLERLGVFWPSCTVVAIRERRKVTFFQNTLSGRRVLVTSTPVLDEGGNLVRVVSNSRDFTELLNLREQLEHAEQKAMKYKTELHRLKQKDTEKALREIIAESEQMRRVVWQAFRVAARNVPVLVLGESGVGKNEVAKLIHHASTRNTGPFIEINCAAIPEALFESELFGYDSGAFTGAQQGGKRGLIDLADKGTLFLNEIGELPLQSQVKLLTVLQDGKFTRVGGRTQMEVDLRVVAATNRPLEQMVKEGKFREDLFYRLNVVSIVIPPLRERPEDILAQAYHYLARFNEKHQTARQFSPPALRILISHRWPGNTRELRNAIERAIVISEGDLIEPEDLDLAAENRDEGGMPTLKETTERVEKELLERAFKMLGSSYKVAEALGISQPTAVRRARKYGIKLTGLNRQR